jgi:hypothetical protein
VKQRAADDPAGGERADVSRPYVIGSLANGKDAGGSASLYFPEQMLQETREAAGRGKGAPGGYAQRFDGVSPDLPRVVVRGWDPDRKAEVESEGFSGSYIVTGVTHAGAADGADLVAHEAVHGVQQSESPPGGPVPVPYPTAAGSGAAAHASGQAGKPLLVIAEDVEGESAGPYGAWAYFRWSH